MTLPRTAPALRNRLSRSTSAALGIGLSVGVALVATGLARWEEASIGRMILEPLVLAILVGIMARTLTPGISAGDVGVRFAAKEVLEVAVLLLGATMDIPRLVASGAPLAIGIVSIVSISLGAGILIGRLAGLPPRLSILVACGNSICGNSAIAAVAPAIGATSAEVAASIALTAMIGIGMVLGLPLLILPLGLSHYQYGILAGLTVYAVPQVLAAAFAVSAVSGQIATVVKLARVLMLGPVVLFFSMRSRARSGARSGSRAQALRAIPWFVVGFVALAALRSFGVLPDGTSSAAGSAARWLMILSMAALGLGVDVRTLRAVGRRVIIAVTGSLTVLLVLAIGLIHLLASR
jgi:uncharacterized integral membrane protein (TIGR00698 family)